MSVERQNLCGCLGIKDRPLRITPQDKRLTKRTRLLCAIPFALALQPLAEASSIFVSYSSATGGGIEAFSLAPQSAGTLFDSENAAVTSLTVANNAAYWVTGTAIFSDNVTDATGGNGKTALPGIPFGGVTVSDLAVDPIASSYLVGWIAPGFGWFIAQYPLIPDGTFNIFVNATAPIQGLTIEGNNAYWLEGSNIWSQALGSTTRNQVQSFTLGPVSLTDLAVDPASQSYLLAASEPGLPPLLARYPLIPNASGNLFAFANDNIGAVTIAGGRAYWIDGSSVWSENLNGTDLTLQETLPAQFTPTDLAVSPDAPVAAPEPVTFVLTGSALTALALVRRRLRGSREKTARGFGRGNNAELLEKTKLIPVVPRLRDLAVNCARNDNAAN